MRSSRSRRYAISRSGEFGHESRRGDVWKVNNLVPLSEKPLLVFEASYLPPAVYVGLGRLLASPEAHRNKLLTQLSVCAQTRRKGAAGGTRRERLGGRIILRHRTGRDRSPRGTEDFSAVTRRIWTKVGPVETSPGRPYP